MWAATGDALTQRRRQIDALRSSVGHPYRLSEIQSGQVFDIQLPTRQIFRINLHSKFPYEAPELYIIPPMQHPSVAQDGSGRILPSIHDKIRNWNINNNLGKAVIEVIEKLTVPQSHQPLPSASHSAPTLHPGAVPMGGALNPVPVTALQNSMNGLSLGPGQSRPVGVMPTGVPFIYGPSSPAGVSAPLSLPTLPTWSSPAHPLAPPVTGTPPGPPSYSSAIAKAQPVGSSLPAVPSSFPELEGKSALELEQMLNDPRELEAFVEQLDVVRKARRVRDELRQTNEQLAKQTLQKGEEIAVLKAIVADKKEEYNQKRVVFDAKKQHQQEVAKKFSPQKLAMDLGEAAGQAERESEELQRRYLDGEMELKDFVSGYLEKRKLYHLRSTKRESLQLQLRDQR